MGGVRVTGCCVKYGGYVVTECVGGGVYTGGFVGGGVYTGGLQLYVTCCVWGCMCVGTG